MKAIILGGLLVSAPTTAQAQSTCASYVDTTVSPQTFDQAVASVKPVAPKGEFETTDAYQGRLAAAGSSGPLIISKKIEGAEYLAYNADKGVFEVKSYLFDNTNFSAWDTFYYAKVTAVKAGTIGNLDVTISSSEVATGTYSAQNGFGAKTTVTKIARTEKAIFDRETARYGEELFPNKDAVIGELPMSTTEAQAFKVQAKIAFVVAPKLPYVVRATYPYGETTISNPTDVTVNATVLVADIQCGLLMNSANQVVAAFQTR